MKTVLLHTCCGVCAFYCVEKLKQIGYAVKIFYYNPNIYPLEEYRKRKEAVEQVSSITAVEILEAARDFSLWQDICGNLSEDEEGGRRCGMCYELRLKRTRDICVEKGFDFFTTTLTVSPRKDSKTIIAIGKKISADKFLSFDFKKQDGFKKTIELSKKHDFYRQNYCGCEYSIKKS